MAVSNVNEDRLHERLLTSNQHNLLNIPVSEVGEVLHIKLGLVLKKIIKVVRCSRDDHGNGNPIPIGNPTGMEIDDTVGNGNGKEWESLCMGMALIPTGINSHRQMQCLAYVISNVQFNM